MSKSTSSKKERKKEKREKRKEKREKRKEKREKRKEKRERGRAGLSANPGANTKKKAFVKYNCIRERTNKNTSRESRYGSSLLNPAPHCRIR